MIKNYALVQIFISPLLDIEDGFEWYRFPDRNKRASKLCSYKTNLIYVTTGNNDTKHPGYMGNNTFFCVKCEDIWAWHKIGLPDNWPRGTCHIINRKCPAHGDGSLVLDWTKYRQAEDLPIELLRWELKHSNRERLVA